MSKADFKNGLLGLVNVSPHHALVAPKWAPSSMELLRWIGQKARQSGYGYYLRLEPERLVKYLVKMRDQILNGSADSEKVKEIEAKYACWCTDEFQEFALLDPVIIECIAKMKANNKTQKKLSANTRKMISIVLDPIFPKSQGFRGWSRTHPLIIKVLYKKDYDELLRLLNSYQSIKHKNPDSRKLSIEAVAVAYLKKKRSSDSDQKLDTVANKFAQDTKKLPANQIALKLIALVTKSSPSALHKAFRLKNPR